MKGCARPVATGEEISIEFAINFLNSIAQGRQASSRVLERRTVACSVSATCADQRKESFMNLARRCLHHRCAHLSSNHVFCAVLARSPVLGCLARIFDIAATPR